MRKTIALLSLFLLFSSNLTALETNLTTRVKLWLLNNEARALSSLSFDAALLSRINSPFSFVPEHAELPMKSAEKLWGIHRKFYWFLDDIEHVYIFAARYGNGRFAIVLKQARPEIWGTMVFNLVKTGISSPLHEIYRKAFYETLIKALNLNIAKDADLSTRLNIAANKLSDDEMRMFNKYLDTFSALFPSDPSAKMIKKFVESGTKKKFAIGISQLLKPEYTLPLGPLGEATSSAKNDFNDPLAELEKLAAMSDSGTGEEILVSQPESSEETSTTDENASSNAAEDSDAETAEEEDEDSTTNKNPEKPLDDSDPGSADMFNIWD